MAARPQPAPDRLQQFPCRRRDLWRRQAAELLQLGVCAVVERRGGVARRAPLARRSSRTLARTPPYSGIRRFPALQAPAARTVYVADRAAARADAFARRPDAQRLDLAAPARRAAVRL